MQTSPLYITHTAGNYRLAAQPEGEIHLAGWVILFETSPNKFLAVRKFTEAMEASRAWRDACEGEDMKEIMEKVYA